jgi:tetratricopeptide (TPR) repeat protein
MIGVCFKMQHAFKEAVTALSSAQSLYNQMGDRTGVGRVLRDLGICYDHQGEHRAAMRWLRKSEAILQNSGEPAELGITQVKIGESFAELGHRSSAARWLNRGLAVLRTTEQWFYEITALKHLGKLQLDLGDSNQAITTLWAAIAIIKEAGAEATTQHRLSQLYGYLVRGYLEVGNRSQATYLLNRVDLILSHMDVKTGEVVSRDLDLTILRDRLRAA